MKSCNNEALKVLGRCDWGVLGSCEGGAISEIMFIMRCYKCWVDLGVLSNCEVGAISEIM